MKTLRFLPILILLVFTSCSSVRVAIDYDKEVNFNSYSTFAFYKPGIDEAQVSDLDKRRILKAIESQLMGKGMTKSSDPDLLVSIFTKEKERVDFYDDYFGFGWGWYPWYGGYYGNNISTTTEGTLYIELIDANSNNLIWQGMGITRLVITSNIEKREERIRLVVNEILSKYPPGSENK